MESVRPRRPWLAGALSLLAPGVGLLYAGNAGAAAIASAVNLFVVPIIWVCWAYAPFSVRAVFIVTSLAGVALYLGAAAWAFVDARRANAQGRPRRVYQQPAAYAGFIALTVLASMFTQGMLGENAIGWYQVPGDSMAPTLVEGDRVVVRRLGDASAPTRGSVVIFADDANQPQVKRVVGLEGDVIQVSGGKVIVNGAETARAAATDSDSRVVVPAETFYVLGDNSTHSSDSRNFGAVPLARYRGKVEGIYLSRDVSRIGRGVD